MSRFQVAGNDFSCQLCQGAEFVERKVKMNTTALTFFDLDWLNKGAQGLVCESCGYVHLFMKKDVVVEVGA